MTDREPGWDLYRTFLDVLRHGSLSGAARRLGLTQPTAGRHIEALEQALGLTLFTRSQRGLTPTEAALDLMPHAEAMAAAHHALLRASSGEARQERGTVRLTASEMVSCEVLPPMLARFGARHPRVAIELAVSNRSQDLLRRDADIAIRIVRPKQKSLVARKLGEVGIGLYAHRDYLAWAGTPTTVEELLTHRLIGFDRDDVSFKSVGGASSFLNRENFSFRCDYDSALMAALKAGVGIGGSQHQIAARYPDLVPVLPDLIAFKLEAWAVMHEDLRSVLRVRLLFDHLCEEFTAYLRKAPA